MRDPFPLPPGLPEPEDDGACDHLRGAPVPEVVLDSTANRRVNVAEAARNRTVLFFYPRTGRPDRPVPPEWDRIPGARG
jgi:hypothetical protein